DDTSFAESLKEKKRILAELVGRDSIPHILIDNAIGTKQVVRDCITQNTLRNLLSMAKLNQPVPIRTMRMNKTEKMRDVDLILRDKYEASVKARLVALGAKDQMQQNIMGQINRIRGCMAEQEVQLKAAKEYLRVNDNDTLELIHEELYQQDFSIWNMTEGAKPMYYPGKSQAATPGFVHHIIDHIDIHTQNIKVLQEAGGKGKAFWAVKFRRIMGQNGVYHVKIYITRRKKFAREIEKMKIAVLHCEGLSEDHRNDLEAFDTENRKLQDEIKGLLEDLRRDLYLLNRVTANQLDNNIFHALVEASVYVRDLAQSAKNVEKFYFERREQLETLDKNTHDFVVEPPVNTSDNFNDAGSDIVENLDNHAEFEYFVKKTADDANDALANLGMLKLQDKGLRMPRT
ncbi:hypothetical protein BG005_000335, partial [Podila minutissima]